MKDIESQIMSDLPEAFEKATGKQTQNRFEVDVERYQDFLDDPALSPEQKAEIIGALWTIISAFVELGFGVNPVQQACGQVKKGLDLRGNSDSTEVQLDQVEKPKDTDAPAL